MTVGNDSHNNHNINNNISNNSSNKTEFVKCLSDFFKRDLVSIPVVKKYPHKIIQDRCGLSAATLELDTASYPNIEYVAGTRLSVYPANPAAHVQAIMDHIIDDIGGSNNNNNNNAAGQQKNIALPPNSEWWSNFVHVHKGESLKLALTYLFDIMTAPTRDIIKLLAEYYFPNPSSISGKAKDIRNKLLAISSSNDAWEKWLCTGHRTLRSLFDELPPVSQGKQRSATKNQPQLAATRLLSELEVQQPRQYSVSNIKSRKRFRTEIIVFQHKFNLRQIELNLRQLRERQSFDYSVSSPKSPHSKSAQSSSKDASGSSSHPSQAAKRLQQQRPRAASSPGARAVPRTSAAVRNVAETSGRSTVSMRSIRSLAPFATSPPISTHQVKRVPSFSGPLMTMYATASSSTQATGAGGGKPGSASSGQHQDQERSTSSMSAASKRDHQQLMHSKMSLLSAPEFAANSDPGPVASPGGRAAPAASVTATPGGPKFDGLCSNYLLDLNTNDTIICEFVENPRFTLKGNRERPIMMIGQDVGLIAFRAFWQQRNLEHDRAQMFYTLFKDLSPKKFGEMQLVCITGHKSRIEELLFKREINAALTSKVLSSVTYLHRKHLVSILSAAHNKSRLVFSQSSSQSERKSNTPLKSPASVPSGKVAAKQAVGGAANRSNSASGQNKNKPNNDNNISMQITNKELLELGDRIYKLLMENHGCLYTCCDPHMTQAIELLTFESVVRNSPTLTRERVTQLLPSWKGRGQNESKHVIPAGQDKDKKTQASSPAIYTLENTYERAKIVQEIYESSI